MRPLRRYRRGAGALVAVLLLAALAGAALAAHYTARDEARGRALDRGAGRTFAAWVLAAHRASQERDFAARLAGGTGFALTPAELRAFGAVAPGLPDRAGKDAAFAVGILDDGAGVGMAFGVLEPGRAGALPALREGALDAGLAAVAEAGDAAAPMAVRLPAIERALGRPVAADALYVTADAGIRYRDDTLYRRPQPGRPWLNRMETGLDAGGRDLADAGAVTALSATVSGDAAAGGTTVDADVDAARLDARSLEAGELDAAGLAVSADLLVGSGRVAGAVRTRSASVSGRLQAAALRASGRLTAGTLAAAGTATITGASSVGSLEGETLAVTGRLQARRIAATGAYGPRARVSGAMTVTRCDGC